MTSHEKLLAEALTLVLIKAGVLQANASMTGPELLLVAEEYIKSRPDGRRA